MIGEWFLPNKMKVLEQKSDTFAPFYRNRSTDGVVSLYRASNTIMSPTGLFCCEVLDVTDKNQEACVNVGEHSFTLKYKI